MVHKFTPNRATQGEIDNSWETGIKRVCGYMCYIEQ
jgi:hypothetical protein